MEGRAAHAAIGRRARRERLASVRRPSGCEKQNSDPAAGPTPRIGSAL
jgi:hypothetical protein